LSETHTQTHACTCTVWNRSTARNIHYCLEHVTYRYCLEHTVQQTLPHNTATHMLYATTQNST